MKYSRITISGILFFKVIKTRVFHMVLKSFLPKSFRFWVERCLYVNFLPEESSGLYTRIWFLIVNLIASDWYFGKVNFSIFSKTCKKQNKTQNYRNNYMKMIKMRYRRNRLFLCNSWNKRLRKLEKFTKYATLYYIRGKNVF